MYFNRVLCNSPTQVLTAVTAATPAVNGYHCWYAGGEPCLCHQCINVCGRVNAALCCKVLCVVNETRKAMWQEN